MGIALIVVGLAQVFFGCVFFRQPGVPLTLLATSRRADKGLKLPGKSLLVSGLLFAVAGAMMDIIAGFR